MSDDSIKTDIGRISQLVRLAAFRFREPAQVTAHLHRNVPGLDGMSPVELARQSSDGWVKAVKYLNEVSIS